MLAFTVHTTTPGWLSLFSEKGKQAAEPGLKPGSISRLLSSSWRQQLEDFPFTTLESSYDKGIAWGQGTAWDPVEQTTCHSLRHVTHWSELGSVHLITFHQEVEA